MCGLAEYKPFFSQNFLSCPSYCLPYNSYGVGSENLALQNPLIEIFLYSHHLPARYCSGIVRIGLSLHLTSEEKEFNDF